MDNFEIDEGFCGEDAGINSPLGIEEPLDETAAISYQEVNLTSIISSTSGNYTTVFLGELGNEVFAGRLLLLLLLFLLQSLKIWV